MKPNGFIAIIVLVFTALGWLNAPKSVFASTMHQNRQSCIFLTTPLEIPEDGSWLPICWTDTAAPVDSTITEVNVKIKVDHPDPAQIELRLSRVGTEFYLPLSHSGFDENGIVAYTQIHEFDGYPSIGDWVIEIRDHAPGAIGELMEVSVAPSYAPGEQGPMFFTEADGKLSQIRIADDAIRIKNFPENDARKLDKSSVEPQLDLLYPVVIMSQDFEGAFPPSSGWELIDNNPYDGKIYLWDDDDHMPFNGEWAAWPANGGADGLDPAFSNYPNNMDSGMLYGPFDLSNAQSAIASFRLWRQIEVENDSIFFGWSTDGAYFEGYWWDGSVGWEEISVSLDDRLGDNNVWVGWFFFSNNSVQYEGPWIDDIVLEFIPKDIVVNGRFTSADRASTMRGAQDIKVQLWDRDANGNNDLLAETFTNSNGYYTFPSLPNWDTDDTDPILGNRRLDLYVLWVLENDHYKVTNSNGYPYAWISSTHDNINMDSITISSSLPYGYVKFQALWIFQDIRRTREFYLSHTNPNTDPGFLTARWEENQNSENVPGSHFWALIHPHVFVAQYSLLSVDTIVHEIAHHVMWNKTGQWLWYEFNCFDHDIFSQESVQCAWSEGWADFLAIAVNGAVNGDVCYDKGVGPCTGVPNQDKYDLENHTRYDENKDGSWWGDGVEGRIAGVLYDLMDSNNESPFYDTAYWGFDRIADIALDGNGQSSLWDFWISYEGHDAHNGVRSIFQNTIDYDLPPGFIPIPAQNSLQNSPHSNFIDLWNYSADIESPDHYLTYQIVSVSDTRCGISLDVHWLNANPQMNWTGSCEVAIRVSDSLEIDETSLWVNILPITNWIYLPVIKNE